MHAEWSHIITDVGNVFPFENHSNVKQRKKAYAKYSEKHMQTVADISAGHA